jgi:antitoxin (DNA-binding transcriptional repressor) of toxin-antitoxin stability system
MSRTIDITATELREDTSSALRRAESGEHLRVLVDRKPVAQLGPLDDASFWVDAEVMEARVRAAQADSALRRELDEPQPDTLADPLKRATTGRPRAV